MPLHSLAAANYPRISATVQGQDAGIVLSPLIGVVVGALVTLVLIILVVVVRVRRERVSKPRHEKPAELSELPPQQYPLQNPQQTVETDPDVIPNKFGKFLSRPISAERIARSPGSTDRSPPGRGALWIFE